MHEPSPLFRLRALPEEMFRPLFDLADAALAVRGVRRQIVEAHPGTPCRVSLLDAAVGETVLLLPYEHQSAAHSPYRSSGAIFVRQDARQAHPAAGELPEMIRRRLLSVRAYDADGMMSAAEVVEGKALEPLIARYFTDPGIAYLHLHNARAGCYNCRVDRV